ncbi:hypothetical protein D9Q98_004946 [Chlorella vulgaris]|uniref:FK506-binding protein n=1 Tax=Chlorella vulgaris TaxID=3077 RepID=A0A9D4TNB4_CHLVU|nr:hypothetical protein D9Q98_004946 [Chlorella vulgaris]
MAFWGCEIKPGKAMPFVPPPEAAKLHLSQACLSNKAKPGTKASLKVRVSDEGEQLLVCSLREGGTESIGLDLIFDQYTEFTVEGGAAIHLTGYFMPEYEMGGEESSDDDEQGLEGYAPGQLLGYDDNGMPVLAGEYDSEDDSDYESEEGDEEDSEEDGNPPRRITIEDITELEAAMRREQKALAGVAQQANGAVAADSSDDDVALSDQEGDSDEDDDVALSEGEDEEESEEGEEEEAQVAAQLPGQKRKAEQQPAAKQQPKQAKQAAATGTPATAAQQRQQAAPGTADKQQQQQQKQQKAAAAATPASAGKTKVRTFPNGFEIEDLKMGRPDGKLAKAGKKVVMRYVGRLKSNGKIFDQTKGAATFSFRLGVGEVIKGWDRGVEGMRVGDKRRLTIPPAMAYGSSGVRGTIPSNATLTFEVELVDVK